MTNSWKLILISKKKVFNKHLQFFSIFCFLAYSTQIWIKIYWNIWFLFISPKCKISISFLLLSFLFCFVLLPVWAPWQDWSCWGKICRCSSRGGQNNSTLEVIPSFLYSCPQNTQTQKKAKKHSSSQRRPTVSPFQSLNNIPGDLSETCCTIAPLLSLLLTIVIAYLLSTVIMNLQSFIGKPSKKKHEYFTVRLCKIDAKNIIVFDGTIHSLKCNLV